MPKKTATGWMSVIPQVAVAAVPVSATPPPAKLTASAALCMMKTAFLKRAAKFAPATGHKEEREQYTDVLSIKQVKIINKAQF